MHADTGGSLRCQVIDEGGQWRPDADAVGWVAGCTCGRRGAPGARVPTWELAEPAARRLAVPCPWADVKAADETRVILEWRRHIAGWQALEDVEQAATRHAAAVPALDETVRAARTAGGWWPTSAEPPV